jgi:ornithine cyclodeaminase/alanine dehydrogenase-like protein (mu-crystallin family)
VSPAPRRMRVLFQSATKGSLLATKLKFGQTNPDLFRICAFGAGKQIEAHVELHLQAYPSVREVDIFNRTVNTRVTDLVSLLRSRYPKVEFRAFSISDRDAMQRVRDARLICCATSSTEPLISASHVGPYTHINLVGAYKPEMVEAHRDLVQRAGRIIVDSREACAVEAGDLLQAGTTGDDMIELGVIAQAIKESAVQHATLSDLNHDKSMAVGGGDGVTIFKSVGVGIQVSGLHVSRLKQLQYWPGYRHYDVGCQARGRDGLRR